MRKESEPKGEDRDGGGERGTTSRGRGNPVQNVNDGKETLGSPEGGRMQSAKEHQQGEQESGPNQTSTRKKGWVRKKYSRSRRGSVKNCRKRPPKGRGRKGQERPVKGGEEKKTEKQSQYWGDGKTPAPIMPGQKGKTHRKTSNGNEGFSSLVQLFPTQKRESGKTKRGNGREGIIEGDLVLSEEFAGKVEIF